MVTWLWARRERRASVDHDLGKMVLGCVQLAGAFGVMGVAALVSRGTGVSGGWLVLAIALLTLGELYVDPIGQALFNRLAVDGLFSVYVSFWFLASLVAYFVSAWLAGAWALLEPGLFFSGMAVMALLGGALIFAARYRHRRGAPFVAVIS
jgi:proton-dependent oligopeptide transporter, POT family